MLGNRIISLRKEQNLTQHELAIKLGISRSALSLYEIEKREPDTETIFKIAQFFNVSTDYLLGVTDERHPSAEYEWRYRPIQNRLGTILSKYREQNNLSNKDFAAKLDISEELELDIEYGKHSPSMPLIQKIATVTKYDVDYIIGAQDSTQIPQEKIEINGVSFDCFVNESDAHFKTRLEELCLKKNITTENTEKSLGLSPQTFNDIRYNRMPTLSELLKISYAFEVSLDYLIGRTDNLITNLSNDELDLLLNYRDCENHYKENLLRRASALSIASIDKSVAADVPSKQPEVKKTMGK